MHQITQKMQILSVIILDNLVNSLFKAHVIFHVTFFPSQTIYGLPLYMYSQVDFGIQKSYLLQTSHLLL